MSLLNPSTWFQSDAEKKVNLIYGQGPANTLNTDAAIFAAAGAPIAPPAYFDPFSGPSNMDLPSNAPSTWESISRAITPESYAESIVNEIYSNPARTLLPDPAYNPGDLSSPNVYVKAKGAVKAAVDSATSFGTRALIIAVGVLLLGVAVYALVPALVRR